MYNILTDEIFLYQSGLGHTIQEERIIKGSYMGSCIAHSDIPKYLDMFQTGKLPVDRLLSRKITFEELNEAMDRLDDAKTVREVLIP